MGPQRITVRRDTLANWQAANPVLGDGEPAWVSDTRDLIAGPGMFLDLWGAAQSIPNRAKASADAAAISASAAKASAADATRLAVATPVGIRATAPWIPYNTGAQANLSNGSDVSATYRRYVEFTATADSVQFAFPNWVDNLGKELSGPNVITVKASVETVAGAIVPLFFNGQRSIVIQPGGTAWSDPLGLRVAKGLGTGLYVRAFVSVAAGQKWPRLYTEFRGKGDYNNRAVAQAGGAVGADMTDTGTWTSPTTTDEVGYGPVSARGIAIPQQSAIVGVVGDSIAAGFGDAGDGQGWFMKAIASRWRVQNVSMSSGKIDAWLMNLEPDGSWRRAPLLDACSDIVVPLGANNLGANLATNSANLVTIYRRFAAQGKRVWGATVTPYTTSTDAWATAANQTVTANEGNRTALNDWLRDGAPMLNGAATGTGSTAAGTVRAGQVGHPLVGVFDPADQAETTRNSGLWRSSGGAWTTDGQHPNTFGSTSIGAATQLAFAAAFGPVAV